MFSLTYAYVQFGMWSIQFHIFGMWSTVYICLVNSYRVCMWSVLFHILVICYQFYDLPIFMRHVELFVSCVSYFFSNELCHTVLFKLNYDDLALCWRQFELLMVAVWSVFCCCVEDKHYGCILFLCCLYFERIFCVSFYWYPTGNWYSPETRRV
jgi:hypothetical protein